MQKEPTTVNGIIYKRRPANEADVFVRILSKNNGVFTASVRGAKKPQSKLNSSVLNFSYGDYLVVLNEKGISQLRSGSHIKQFEQLFSDIKLNAYASYFLDLVDHAVVDYEVVPGIYDLIFASLTMLNEQKNPDIILALVKIRMLEYFGVKPELAHCVLCDQVHQNYDYSIELGGIVGTDHFETSRLNFDPKVISLLRTLGLLPIEKLGNIEISAYLTNQLLKLLDLIYQRTMDLNLKTEKFIRELDEMEF